MRINLRHIAPLLAAGAAAVAIAAAPTAMAASAPQPCTMMGGEPVCPGTHSTLISPPPGNSEINASPGGVGFGPQYPYDEGGYWGGYGGGFGHGGGFGGGGGGHGR
ncbi:hypothetical protein [Mycobacterium sp.]|jgi:hypothetical protein|uniref:hypothetical protein n=1 Tax=Mycobacterium sp. TaxID=1785 RepID=UPI002D4DA7EA|nr:hypothetical protein [Mycobacterium sp.]HZA12255.1 hypothetical protein [Mycobacterium sp.]